MILRWLPKARKQARGEDFWVQHLQLQLGCCSVLPAPMYDFSLELHLPYMFSLHPLPSKLLAYTNGLLYSLLTIVDSFLSSLFFR